ncbi:16S rRNA methyltransferase [Wigglesworthia glossinidia endosymbiont of Glossina morsitans morsitans (Yale colony)]|uniref:Ribosomal RNA small subunit methyltransferase E n=1 Tax=Wigglesworthia glossinidia endosymbiont of Glossina morsitans morsitans (Yale colony) TaxID=1142511 RepID=H6Q5E7_WIGGL|nr:16S rRNA (uracil(1498)-N(3))-methyltransferase [Wigglesworthia glossinidia]AFA41430.1 16S rRNA methyltransferase [Wigglesworthia glossinidia endosymbiont of Glossina morsitans morsitans (Yale colony)]
MHIFRIYHSQELSLNKTIIISDQSMNYLKNVLRMKLGNLIKLFNNKNQEYLGKIVKFDNKKIYICLTKKIHSNVESPLKIYLGQSICNRTSMEYIFQKSVELGVYEITPLFSEHCYINGNHYQIKNKMKRWKTIVIHASQQCGRKSLLKINCPMSMLEWCKKKNNILSIYTDLRSKNKMNDIRSHYNQARLLVGPEGGFSKYENAYLMKNNFYKIRIGPRTLRVETSVLSAIALLQMRFGDF